MVLKKPKKKQPGRGSEKEDRPASPTQQTRSQTSGKEIVELSKESQDDWQSGRWWKGKSDKK